MAGPGGREVGRVSIRVLPDTTAFGRSLEKYLDRMERRLRVEIPAVIDSTGIEKEVRRVTNVAERGAKVNLPATLDERGLNARVTALVKRLSGKEITIGVDIDRGLERARSGFATLGRIMSSLTLPVTLVSAVPTLLGLGAAAGQAAAALYVLPAAGLAGAAGISALVIAFKGFGDAMKNMDDPEAFAKSLESLAPAARDTAVAIRGLRPAFSDMQLHVQQQLFDGLATTIRDLGGTYLPILKNGLGGVAQSMGDMADSAGKALIRPDAISAVNNVLARTHEMFQAMVPALGNFLRGFLSIADVGAKFLPAFGQSVSNVAERFAAWAGSATTATNLTIAIRNAADVLREMGAIAGNVGSVLSGLFDAAGASGAGALASIRALTQGLADFVNSTAGAAAIGQIFSGIGAAMAGIVPAVTQVVQALVIGLGPVIEQLGPAVGQLATQLGSVLVGAIQLLAPLLLQMATFLNENMTWLGPIAIAIGGVVAALAAIGPVITFVTNLATAFKLAALAFRVLSTALLANPFVAIAAAVIALAILIYSNWDSIKSYLAAAWQWIASTAASVWNGLVSFFAGIWSSITGFFSSAASTMSSIMSSAWSGLVSIVSTGVTNVVNFVRALPGRILGALGNLGRLLWSAGADLVRGMINGVRSMISNLLGVVRDMAARAVSSVKSALGIGSPSKVFRQLGKWTGEGFADGIQRGTPDAITAAQDMARAVAATPPAAMPAPVFGGAGGSAMRDAVMAGVLAGLDGSRMRVEGDGVARLVNKTNAVNARR